MKRIAEMKVRSLSPGNEAALERALGLLRRLYNACLEQRIWAWRQRKASLSFYDQCKNLTELRAVEPKYAALDATMERLTAVRRVDLAFKAFFRRCKTNEKPGFPRFQGRDRFATIVFGASGWKLVGRKLTLRGIGTLKLTKEPHRQGIPLGLRLVKRTGRWFVQLVLDVGEAPVVSQSAHGIGIDVGICTFAAMSDGTTVDHPRFLRKSLEQLKTMGRNLSSKRRGSVRRSKAKAALARLHAKVANRRKDFVRQAAAALVKRYDGFAVEDLSVKAMAQAASRGLARGIMDSGWRLFMDALAAKAEEAGLPFVRVPARGTSQRCSGCGSIVRKGLGDRWHRCYACGLSLDRDHNAAINIFDLGWRSAAE